MQFEYVTPLNRACSAIWAILHAFPNTLNQGNPERAVMDF
jgi:hypothetical protein